jgi:hypothetical protein
MIEVIGNIIHGFLAQDDSPSSAKTIEDFYEIIIQRFLDIKYFVRARVLKVLIKLTEYFL